VSHCDDRRATVYATIRARLGQRDRSRDRSRVRILSRREYTQAVRKRYSKIQSKHERGRVLDEYMLTTNCHRKHAIRTLGRAPAALGRQQRRSKFDDAAINALVMIWRAAGKPCSTRLLAMLRLWLPAAQRSHGVLESIGELLLSASARSFDRLLRPYRSSEKERSCRGMAASSRIKRHIPIRSQPWDLKVETGLCEVDTVWHSGESSQGNFAYSVNVTDISSGWTEARATLGKQPLQITEKLKEIRSSFPFPVSGLDSDNGGEFLNDHYLRWCRTNKIAPTRSRPGVKNDNAYIEQKNCANVRKVFGDRRIDTRLAVDLMNELYRNELRVYWNYFQASAKLRERGARKSRRHDDPQAPLDRIIKLRAVGYEKAVELIAHRDSIDPFELSASIKAKVLAIVASPLPGERNDLGGQLSFW
jgi:hypothetical protein